VKEAVREFLRVRQEVFMPLIHRPGEAQVDFGYALARVYSLRLAENCQDGLSEARQTVKAIHRPLIEDSDHKGEGREAQQSGGAL
jgi:hypothetical protein